MSESYPPPPESSYNPRLFMIMSGNPEVWERSMPDAITNILGMGEGMVTTPLFDRARRTIKNFVDEAPMVFTDYLYSDFAHQNKWVRNGEGILSILVMAVPMASLDADQMEAWNHYRQSGEVPRRVAMSALRVAVMPLDQLAPMKREADQDLSGIIDELLSVPFKLTLKFFPDIIDEEAKQMFSGHTVDDLKKRALTSSQK